MSGDYKPTVVDLLDHIAAVFCDKYCKWPEKYKTEDGDEDGRLYDEKCGDCPLNDLGI